MKTAPSDDLLRLGPVNKRFILDGRDVPVLVDVSFSICSGESVALMGRSGSGKSTLLNLIGLLDRPTSGKIVFRGVEASNLSESKRAVLRGSSIGFIYQQFHLLDHRTALENVAEPLLFGRARDVLVRNRRSADLLSAVGLQDRFDSMPHQLSGGEQQRVAIARALARSPQLICADEPTGALDSATSESVLNLLFGLVRSTGASLILATHDERVASRADRVVRIVDGRVVGGDKS